MFDEIVHSDLNNNGNIDVEGKTFCLTGKFKIVTKQRDI